MCGLKPCGKATCSWGLQYLQQCEARMVMKMAYSERGAFYVLVKKCRGEKALNELKGRVKSEWLQEQGSPTRQQQGALL